MDLTEDHLGVCSAAYFPCCEYHFLSRSLRGHVAFIFKLEHLTLSLPLSLPFLFSPFLTTSSLLYHLYYKRFILIFYITHLLVYFAHVHVWHGIHMEIRGQITVVGSLLPCGLWLCISYLSRLRTKKNNLRAEDVVEKVS